jgi:hypothetical protein
LGTQEAISRLTGSITCYLENKKKCIAVFLDLAKAFDTVSQKILLKKLEAVGIRGLAQKFLTSYLSGRTQAVKIGNKLSNQENIPFEVPQGSTLGPLLFIIYINELCNMDVGGDIVTFADDTAIVFGDSTWPEVFKRAEFGLSLINKWLSEHLLTINVDKTKFMPFSLTATGAPRETKFLRMHSCRDLTNDCVCPHISSCKEIKYLGLIIDQHLRWDAYLGALTKRLGKLLYVFKTLRNVLNDNIIKSVYFALFQSVMLYGIESWGSTATVHLQPINVAQKAILRIMGDVGYLSPSEPLFKRFKVLDARQLYMQRILVRYFGSDALVNQTEGHGLRSLTHGVRRLPRMRTALGQRSPEYLAPKLMNRLPSTVKDCESVNVFKRRLTEWLLTSGRERSRFELFSVLT